MNRLKGVWLGLRALAAVADGDEARLAKIMNEAGGEEPASPAPGTCIPGCVRGCPGHVGDCVLPKGAA